MNDVCKTHFCPWFWTYHYHQKNRRWPKTRPDQKFVWTLLYTTAAKICKANDCTDCCTTILNAHLFAWTPLDSSAYANCMHYVRKSLIFCVIWRKWAFDHKLTVHYCSQNLRHFWRFLTTVSTADRRRSSCRRIAISWTNLYWTNTLVKEVWENVRNIKVAGKGGKEGAKVDKKVFNFCLDFFLSKTLYQEYNYMHFMSRYLKYLKSSFTRGSFVTIVSPDMTWGLLPYKAWKSLIALNEKPESSSLKMKWRLD